MSLYKAMHYTAAPPSLHSGATLGLTPDERAIGMRIQDFLANTFTASGMAVDRNAFHVNYQKATDQLTVDFAMDSQGHPTMNGDNRRRLVLNRHGQTTLNDYSASEDVWSRAGVSKPHSPSTPHEERLTGIVASAKQFAVGVQKKLSMVPA
jgi:hypothetical protein